MDLAEIAARAQALAVPLGAAAMGAVWAYDAYVRWRLPRHESDDAHGSAHWADHDELRRAGLLAGQGLYVGRWHRKPLRLATDRHLCTLAPTRSGKGVAAILPNLLTYPGSMIVVDPKGEAVAVAARRRRQMGQQVYILDPWEITRAAGARFNPLADLSADSKNLFEDSASLAQALVPDGHGDDSHWLNEARALLAGFILHVVTGEPPALRHLGRVRQLLVQPAASFQSTLAAMAQSQAASGLVARAAYRQMQKSPREAAGVVSTAQAQTNFLDAPRLVDNLGASSFDFGSLKSKPATVFIVLPADQLDTFGRWLRLLISQALTEMIRQPGRPAAPVLVVLDEFAALGHLPAVETAMGLLAGYGVQLWPVLQDLSQLQDIYPHRWPTFIGNAGMLQAFGCADPVTAEFLSDRLGRRTVAVRGRSLGGAALGGYGPNQYSEGHNVAGRPLLTPDELLRMPSDDELLFLPGFAPVRAHKLSYYRDGEFSGMFDANPMRAAA